jgi:VWFA-related protein
MIRTLASIAALAAGAIIAASAQEQDPQVFRFRTGVELINVTATVTDNSGRFVSGLTKEDFRLFEDGDEQEITHFNSERVPVSLGLVIDTSGSMEGEKWSSARQALNRFLFELLDRDDEIFLYRFDNMPELVEGWTTDRQRISNGLARIRPRGATSLYDAIAEALPLAQSGRHRKKAIVVISDGNDTNSRLSIRELKPLIRETEVLVYAIGIDGNAVGTFNVPSSPPPLIYPPRRGPVPRPFPIPGGRRNPGPPPRNPPGRPPGGSSVQRGVLNDRVNVTALRDITDDSGGRTELVRSGRDLEPATTSVADELSKQYYIGYPSQRKRDGRWHTISVSVHNGNYLVRARRGYVATP